MSASDSESGWVGDLTRSLSPGGLWGRDSQAPGRTGRSRAGPAGPFDHLVKGEEEVRVVGMLSRPNRRSGSAVPPVSTTCCTPIFGVRTFAISHIFGALTLAICHALIAGVPPYPPIWCLKKGERVPCAL